MKNLQHSIDINIDIKSIVLLPIALIFILLNGTAMANQPFYFIAKQAPEGSLTQQGSQTSVVYLRWDIVEGELPSDITQFDLYRNGTLIQQFPANQLLSAQAVTRLYQGVSQRRRLIETIALLKEESVLDPSVNNIDVNDYGITIINRIQADNYWAQLASKRDFNIAIARNRGFIDRPGSGVFSYELKAINAAMQSKRIGLVSVDTSQTQQLLPIPSFEQLSLSQCDIPDIKDHYSVALNWSGVGLNNMADRIANQLFVGGYDLYRSKSNIDAALTRAPERDLATEAMSLSFNLSGQVNFADLERVNDTLITVFADFDAASPEWLETHDDLIKAGLKPGDKRAYYLVARDFTGNFGPTINTIVTVGDMSRPPAPWDIDVYLSEENQQVELSFEKIDADSYLESFGHSKRICGISETGAISFVAQDESCAEQRHKIIRTDVSDYLLYRFDNFADASRFKDSDGDGFSDRAERPTNSQCVAANDIGDNLVESNFEEQTLDNHIRIRVSDEQPALQKGDIYWYRLAAKSTSGRLSFLSEPVRVNFPDRTLPESPAVSVTYPGDGTEACGCELDYANTNEDWSFSMDNRLGNSLTLSCNGNDYSISPKDIDDNDAAACQTNYLPGNLASDCASGGQISASPSGFSCSANLPANANFCESGSMQLKARSCESVEAPSGVLVGPVTITATPNNSEHCVSIYQQISGELIKVSSSCGEASSSDSYVIDKGEFCGQAVTHDVNNNISVATQIECREVISSLDNSPLLAPRIDILQMGDTFASVNVALPTQGQSFMEVELSKKSPQASDTQVARVGIASATNNMTTVNFDIPALAGANDQWCARARIHGASENVGQARLSSWSKEVCELRASSAATMPKWLSWPGMKQAEQGEDLIVKNNAEFGVLPQSSPISDGFHIEIHAQQNACRMSPNSVTLLGEVAQTPIAQGPALINADCSSVDRAYLVGAYEPKLNFVVYRQTRVNGQISDFKQVSPLIDYAHWIQTLDAKNEPRFVLKDPYIWASTNDMNTRETLKLHYVDRAPVLFGREYRYQFVYFDAKHALVSWRQSPWIAAQRTNAQGTESKSALQLLGGLR